MYCDNVWLSCSFYLCWRIDYFYVIDWVRLIGWLRSDLLIRLIQIRLPENDSRDWVIANIWCIILHRSHYQDSLVVWHVSMFSQQLWPYFMATGSANFSSLRQRLAYISRSKSPELLDVPNSCMRNLREPCRRCQLVSMVSERVKPVLLLTHPVRLSLSRSLIWSLEQALSLHQGGHHSRSRPSIYWYTPQQDRSPIYTYIYQYALQDRSQFGLTNTGNITSGQVTNILI